MSRLLARFKDELGALGLVAGSLLAGSMLFYVAMVRPLEQRLVRLDHALEHAAKHLRTEPPQGRPTSLRAFYRLFESDEGKAIWLARIYSIAASSGVDLRSGEYRFADSPGRIERYQITLPMSGSYSQISAFLETALVEIPMLSLDQVSFRRKSVGDSRAEADVSITLHLLKR